MNSKLKAALETTDAFRKDWMQTNLSRLGIKAKNFVYKGLECLIVEISSKLSDETKFRWELFGLPNKGKFFASREEAIADFKAMVDEDQNGDI